MPQRSGPTAAEDTAQEAGLLVGCERLAPGFYLGPQGRCPEHLAPFQSGDGVGLNERAKLEMTTSFFETPVYAEAIRAALAEMPDGIILELGAGDGRITRLLLAHWPGPVLACDCNRSALERLYADLSEQQRQRAVLVCRSMAEMPLPEGRISGIVAFESLYYLGQHFEQTLGALAVALTPAGRLLHAEPTLEGWLLYCIAVDDWEGALAAALHGVVESRYRGFTPEQMQDIYSRAGLRLLRQANTPLVNIVLVNRLLRSTLPEAKRLETLRAIRSATPAWTIPRCIIYTAAKASGQEPHE